MPQCSKARRPPRSSAAPWASLRSRTLGARLRSHSTKCLAATSRPTTKRRPKGRKRKSGRPPTSLPEDRNQNFLCGHAFEVLFAVGLVPSQRRLLQLDSSSSKNSLNRMHVMEGDCDKSSEMVAESAPDLVNTEDLKLTKEEPEMVAEGGDKSPCQELVKDCVPMVNGQVKEDKSESDVGIVAQSCVDSSKVEEERTKPLEAVEPSAKEGVKEVKDSVVGSGGCSEEEDRNSVTSSQSRKRTLAEAEGEGSSSESDAGGSKRGRLENDDGEDERERLVREYVEEYAESVGEMTKASDKLQREIGALGDLLRTKELEWNSILRLRKLKEEMLERLLRQRRLCNILVETKDEPPKPPIFNKEEKMAVAATSMSSPIVSQSHTNGGMMMVPMFGRPPHPMPRGPRLPPRTILPKPPLEHNSVVGEGRSRHPEHVPRRGRRQRPPDGPTRPLLDHPSPVVSSTRITGSPALMSMANMALGSGSHVRENPSAASSFLGGPGQEHSRPSSADSSRSGPPLEMQGLSFKDALVHFAKLSQPAKPPPPPPPYPEVTLHPVSPPPPHTSLLHGILTKPTPRATTFSPTLARLLTAPERNPVMVQPMSSPHPAPPSHFRQPASRVNITDILSSSKKNQNSEITITPVSGSNKTKDVVLLQGEDEEEQDGDRLVIDESRDASGAPELPENVPECQGCHQRAAQFVCAGCGNQWYCSRECQVTAWEDHSEVCSG